MNKDLENELYKLGPILYQEKDLPMQQTCMCWGFECPDSWFDLLKELTITLESINNTYKGKYECVAQQVKEKFGYLSFYGGVKVLIDNPTKDDLKLADELDKQFHKAVCKAEYQSSQVCCMCGKPSTKVSRGYVLYYCDECFDKQFK